MNLFRSEEHVRRWPLHYSSVDDYILPIEQWDTILSLPLYRNRLAPDYLSRIDDYTAEYHRAFEALGLRKPEEERVLKTVLFTDIVDSTRRASAEGDNAWLALLEQHDELVRLQLSRFRGQEVKQTGDGFLAVFDSPSSAVQCAVAISEAVKEVGLESRAGVHLGECEMRENDVAGIAVHIGARIGGLAKSGEVLVSRSVVDAMTGSGVTFEPQGVRSLKGVPGEWEILSAQP